MLKMNEEGHASLLLTLFLAVLVILMVLGRLPYKFYLVQSGSMAPTINVGDAILVKKGELFELNKVITFTDSDGRTVTHRVVGVNADGSIMTKGDANKDNDRAVIGRYQVVGEVSVVLPKMGYMAGFIKTLPGMLLLIFIPAGYLIFWELLSINREIKGV